MIPYTRDDFKKYVYAKGVHRTRRIEEIINALVVVDGFDKGEAFDDLGYQLDEVRGWLWQTAFVDDDDQAEAEWKRDRAWARSRPPNLEVATCHPESVKAWEAAAVYSDGRPVSTTLRFGDGEHDYVTYFWHPDPLHPRNRPGAVVEVSEGPYPFRFRQIVVTAPGVVDTFVDEDDRRKEPDDPNLNALDFDAEEDQL